MSEGIKRMLAERQAKPPAPKSVPPFDDLFERIDMAAPFIDEGCAPNRWRPSEILKVTYCMMADGDSGPRRARLMVEKHLRTARDRYKRGEHPNPFGEAA